MKNGIHYKREPSSQSFTSVPHSCESRNLLLPNEIPGQARNEEHRDLDIRGQARNEVFGVPVSVMHPNLSEFASLRL